MSEFSVKKPFTVFVAVIAVLVLGVVSYLKMTPDLLPNMDFPYVMIMTTYPGATPEKVEAEVSKPMEQAMARLEHIKQVTSTSSENYSTVLLEFEEAVNMDTVGVDIQQAITTLSSAWDEMVGTPYVLKINPSMLPVEVAAVAMEGMTTLELTEFLEDTLLNKLEGIPGVARISTTGTVQQELHVILDQKLIDKANDTVAAAINAELDKTAEELQDKKEELEDNKKDISNAQSQLNNGASAIIAGEEKLREEKSKLLQMQQELQDQLIQAKAGRAALVTSYEALKALQDQVNNVLTVQKQAKEKVARLEDLQAQRADIRKLEGELSALRLQAGLPQEETEPEETEPLETLPPETLPEFTLPQFTLPTLPPETEPTEPAFDYSGGWEGSWLDPHKTSAVGEAGAAAHALHRPEAGQERVVDLGGFKAIITDTSGDIALKTVAEQDLSVQIAQKEAELAAARAKFNAGLTAEGITAAQLDSALAQAKSDLDRANRAVETVDSLLAGQNTDRAGLSAAVADTGKQLDALDSGIDQLEDGLGQLEDGLLTMEEAEAMLEQQKITGMVQIGTAAGQLAAGAASLEMALGQVESGLEQLEDGRADALKQSDLNTIITMDMIASILTAQNFAMPAGYVEQEGFSYMVSVGEEITSQETLENLLLFDLGMEGVAPIYLKDVAVVMLTDNREETYAKLDGENGIMLSFEKQSAWATAETTNNINARFRQLEEEYPGLRFVSLMNQGDYIYLIVETILNSLLLGALFAILVLYVFLRDLRPTFITLCAIPISVVFAIVLMYFSGVTINMISLSGLAVAVGMLVDNSVVVIENIYRLRAKGANAIQAAVSGAKQVAGAVTSSTLTTVCVFLPIVFVEGLTRQLFTDLALTMTYSLMASLIVSLTLVPAMAAGMLRKEKEIKTTFFDKFLTGYQKLVSWTLDHKITVLAASLALLIATGWGALSRGFIFMPEMDMPNITVTVTMPEDATMEEAASLADQVLERTASLEGIASMGAMMDVGNEMIGGMAQTSYSLTIYVNLSDQDAFGSVLGKQIEDLCRDLPCTVSASSAMMDMSILSGSGISLQIYCDDMEDLQAAAQTAAARLELLEGVKEVSDGLEDAAPALHVDVDRNKAMAKGLTVAQVYMELASALTRSTTSTTLVLEGTTTDLVIEKPEQSRLDLEDLENYTFEVTDKAGETKTFPLKEIATVRHTSSLSTIQRLDQRRYLTVTAELEPGYNVTLVTAEAQKALETLNLGDGVTTVFSGENETIMDAIRQLMLMLLLGILLVYLVMVAQFQSLKSPFIVMFTIPLAFTGGFMGLLLCGMEVSVISLIGFVMLTGVIVNNGIVLVDYINQLRLEGANRRAAIVEAGSTRMRPILMTTVTTVLGLLDMAVNKTAGTAIMQPVAVVCIGGLTYATVMTLFVVPCIYDLLNRKDLRIVREEDLKLLDL